MAHEQSHQPAHPAKVAEQVEAFDSVANLAQSRCVRPPMKASPLNSNSQATRSLRVASTVAPEDLQPGDYLAVLNRTVEFPSYLWDGCGGGTQGPEVVRVQVQSRDGGLPLKVQALCLPFVLLRTHDGKASTADVRQVEFVRLDKSYAKLACKQLARNTPAPALEF